MDADPLNVSSATCQLDTKALSTATTTGGGDPLIGREVIGQYRIEKKLGEGGMGAVYLAQQTTVQRPAVIKVLRSQVDDKQGGKLDLAARFAIEARAASNLNHPNIVTIYNYGQMEDGTLFLAMEYLAGETLEARIARCGQLPVDRAVHVAAQIASALGEAHARGVVHRDLKPANVMLVERAGETDFVKVLDFGIAKTNDAGVTSAGYVVGTPRYMSPEQLLGKQADRRSDIYSAGIVLYEMLAGKPPFSSETPIGWVRQHVDVAPKPPSALIKGSSKISPALDRAVLRAIAKTPADRPATMEDLARDLEAALREPPPPPWWHRAARGFAIRLVALLHAFGSGSRHFLRACGSGVWRFVKSVGRGTRRFIRAMGSGAWRFVRAIGRGMRRFIRAMGSGAWRFLRAIGRAIRRACRAIVSGARRFVLAPPVRLAKLVGRGARASIATKRRRGFVVLTVIAAGAVAVALLFPSTADRFFASAKPEISKTKPSRHRAPARPPLRSPAPAKRP